MVEIDEYELKGCIENKLKLEKVDLVITDTPTFQIFIQKPLKSLSSKRKRAIIHER